MVIVFFLLEFHTDCREKFQWSGRRGNGPQFPSWWICKNGLTTIRFPFSYRTCLLIHISCLFQITVTPLGALSRTEPDAIPYFKACVSRLVDNFSSPGSSFSRSRGWAMKFLKLFIYRHDQVPHCFFLPHNIVTIHGQYCHSCYLNVITAISMCILLHSLCQNYAFTNGCPLLYHASCKKNRLIYKFILVFNIQQEHLN